MKIVEHLCPKCIHFDMCDNECSEGHFLNSLGEYEVVGECEDFSDVSSDVENTDGCWNCIWRSNCTDYDERYEICTKYDRKDMGGDTE